MAKYVSAGVGTAKMLTPDGSLILTANTLTTSGISINASPEEIRGGMSAKLLSQYFHSSTMAINLTDALFDLNYIALQVGSQIQVGGEVFTEESNIITTVPNQITVAGTPAAWDSLGLVGGYRIVGQETWQKITFVGQTATVPDLPAGSKVCVWYYGANSTIRQLTVPAAIIPSEVRLVLTVPLFNAGSSGSDFSLSSQVGNLVIEVPRFLMSGSVSLDLDMSGAATTSLAGTALVSHEGSNSCSDVGQYAYIKEIIFGRKVTDGLVALGVSNHEIDLTTGQNATLKVWGIYDTLITGLMRNKDLTFTSDTLSVATVNTEGVVTAAGAGTAKITIVATGTTIETCAQVSVTA